MGVHVFVDLCGLHANGTRIYAVFARRPAAVQVAYMAFAASTGADFITHLASDRATSPPELRALYTEVAPAILTASRHPYDTRLAVLLLTDSIVD
jgi:predicted O-linked N-acetylglucosamine transferase (SPINDLY family)